MNHLTQIHTQFFSDFEEKDECLKDTKYYIRKLKNEIFSFDKVVSFEALIPSNVDVASSFEGQMCDQSNLGRSLNLKKQITEAYQRDTDCSLQGIMLVPDNLSERR